jgi:zinc transporter ZupT
MSARIRSLEEADVAPRSHAVAAVARRRWRRFGLLALPLVLLAAVVALFLATRGGGLAIEPAGPIESVQFANTLLRPGEIEIRLRNTGPQPLAIAQVKVNDAMWPFRVTPDRVVPRLGEATIRLDYPWVQGDPYDITVFSANAVAFDTRVEIAATTPRATAATLVELTLIGVYVGILPVLLGMLWLPALGEFGPRALTFALALTVGLLVYLGIDAFAESIEIAAGLGGPVQGVGLVGIGMVATFLLLDAISRRQAALGVDPGAKRLAVAFAIAAGIGLHNLGEGLAIGAAFSVGAAALGTFLVIGFIVQNVTEGLGIVVPIARDRPSLRTLGLLGCIGGAPAILGTWIGGLVASQPLAALFLAIGAGAVFQVAWEIGRLIRGDRAPLPFVEFAGVAGGMALLYVLGLFVK